MSLTADLDRLRQDTRADLPGHVINVIDTDRIIRIAFVDPDYTRRLDPAEILSALRQMKDTA